MKGFFFHVYSLFLHQFLLKTVFYLDIILNATFGKVLDP